MKKNKLIVSISLLVGLSLASFTSDTETESYSVRTDKSKLKWTGRKVGGEHHGTLQLKSGSFTLENDLISSGTFIIDMTTLALVDFESKKLFKHLRSKDFFNVEIYKESKLVITGSKMVDSSMIVSGNLTIKNKTNPVSFKAVNIGKTENFRIYSAKIVVDRTKYGIIYRSSAVGDAFISDDFELKVKITGEKQVE